jgi:hypothetical protein
MFKKCCKYSLNSLIKTKKAPKGKTANEKTKLNKKWPQKKNATIPYHPNNSTDPELFWENLTQ